MNKPLADNVTIADIATRLNRPDEYMRRVLGNMSSCKKKHGAAFVRIGTTGRGLAPHYRVEPEFEFEKILDGDLWDAQFVAYHGRSHKQLSWGFGELRDDHWSVDKMSFEEVQHLLGSLRSFERRKV